MASAADVSIIIPAYQPGPDLVALIQELAGAGVSPIIVVK
jgi:hypothetical protein